jgi:phosphatidylglycerophosphate synthase
VLIVRRVAVVGLMTQAALLAVLEATVGLSGAGWAVGAMCGVAASVGIVRGFARRAHAFGPADRVTFLRVTMACAVAALVADAFVQKPALGPLLALTVAALALDAVDGLVARSTGTASSFGARFDGEADAFLILVLSVFVARTAGGWVLAIGAARYAFALASWALPWLRPSLPPRYWRKVVTATQGIVLALAAANVLPAPALQAGLLAALALLTESFGRDVLWLWRRRRSEPVRARVDHGSQARLYAESS